jgi:hypothetical protein
MKPNPFTHRLEWVYLYQTVTINEYATLVEWYVEVSGEKPVPVHFIYHKFRMCYPGIEHDLCGE